MEVSRCVDQGGSDVTYLGWGTLSSPAAPEHFGIFWQKCHGPHTFADSADTSESSPGEKHHLERVSDGCTIDRHVGPLRKSSSLMVSVAFSGY